MINSFSLPVSRIDDIMQRYVQRREFQTFITELAEAIDATTRGLKSRYHPSASSLLGLVPQIGQLSDDRHANFRQRCLYADRGIFREYPQVPPSSEKPHVLRLEATTGCSWNKCDYCTLYRDERFQMMSVDEFRSHVRSAKAFLGKDELKKFRRIFLTGGNAFAIPTERLLAMIAIIRKELGSSMKIACYATTEDILRKSKDDLIRLYAAGITMIHWGIESGSDAVLEYINKRHRSADIQRAGELLHGTGIQKSVTVMPGLGGIKHSVAHVVETLHVL